MKEIKYRIYSRDETNSFSMGRLRYIDLETVNDLPFEIMQYTGLKDKNGVDIYEDDIVKGSAYEKEIYTGVVEFYDASFIMKIDGSKGHYRLNKMTFQSLEVIGNIHENKELLDK